MSDPGSAPHPQVHEEGQADNGGEGGGKGLLTRPTNQVGDRLEKVHAEESGDEGNGHEEGCDDRQHLHDLVHAVVCD